MSDATFVNTDIEELEEANSKIEQLEQDNEALQLELTALKSLDANAELEQALQRIKDLEQELDALTAPQSPAPPLFHTDSVFALKKDRPFALRKMVGGEIRQFGFGLQ
jgi:chromosome segregation ATPase